MSNILENVICCTETLPDLRKENSLENGQKWLKEMCNAYKELINSVETFLNSSVNNSENSVILLYLLQFHSLLRFCNQIFMEENNSVVLKDARLCCYKCIVHCLAGIKSFVEKEEIMQSEESGSFIKWMDLCLDKLSQIDPKMSETEREVSFQDCYESIEEVLCHAMSIAQIAFHEDSKVIKGSCQAVLTALNCLKCEISKPHLNTAMCNVFIDSCSDKLCLLERKVNTAVLRLCLKIFADVTGPLDNIKQHCFQQTEQLNQAVSEFDLHVDRIMQIGLFAIACSTHLQYVIKLKANLASIEALETYLVPSFLQLSKKPSLDNVRCADVFKRFWISNVKDLKQLIYQIIEPCAFCQVAYEELKEFLTDLSNLVNTKKVSLSKESIKFMINQAKVLEEMVAVSFDYLDKDNLPDFKIKFNKLKAVLHELSSASEYFFHENDIINNVQDCHRILKRCKILINLVRQILYSYLQKNKEEENAGDNEYHSEVCELNSKRAAENGYHSKLKSDSFDNEENKFLMHIMNKGKHILNERSILYRTPTKSSCANGKNTSNNSSTVCRNRPSHSLKRICLAFKDNDCRTTNKEINDTMAELRAKSILK